MTSNAKKGNSFLLQVADKYDGSVYTTVAAMRSTAMTISNTTVDVTTKDSMWQCLLPGGGVRSMSISADGVFTDDATHSLLLDSIMGKIAATGEVVFGVNPSNDDEFIFNGVTWTFKTSGASGTETNIAGTLELTLDQLIIDMNANGNASLIVATYTNDATTVTVTHDTNGVAGNTYTLADGAQGGANTTPSAATLTGGTVQDQSWNMRMIDEIGDTWTGSFQTESYERGGDANAEDTFSITLSSASEITFAAA